MNAISHYTGRWAAALAIVFALAFPACKKQPPPAMHGTELANPLEKPAVTMVDTSGADYDLRARTANKLTLLFFGYTYCPDICPLHMANIAAVLRDLPYAQRALIEVVFVTVDPERDTPERLQSWLASFDPKFVGLREKNAGDLAKVNRALYLPTAVTYPTETGEYSVGHPAQVIAFDADGLARWVYPFGTRQEHWAHDLKFLLAGAAEQQGKPVQTPAQPLPVKGALQIQHVLIPEPPATTAALYADFLNTGPDDALLAIMTPAAKHAALHEQVQTQEGSMAMRHVAKIMLPAKQTTRLAPGGFHGMLMGFEGYARGATVPIIFEFQNAGRIHAVAKVVGYDELESAQSQEGK